jgi:hypothetical protein
VLDALVATIVNGGTVNLTNQNDVINLVDATLAQDTNLTGPFDPVLVSKLSSVIAEINAFEINTVASANTPIDALAAGIAVALVAQGSVSTALGDLTQIDAIVAAYTGQSLSDAVTQAAADIAPPACFVSGTRIRTDRGDVAVEALCVGHRVITLSGAARAIVWLGSRSIDITRHATPADVMPVCIAAHAFGESLPARDLLLSPEHAVFADGILIPVGALVNGTSITIAPMERVTYWHVELETHDVIFAEGLASESYFENGNRDDFDGSGTVASHPLFEGSASIVAVPYASVLRQGPQVEAVWRRLQQSSLTTVFSPSSLMALQ